MTTTNMYLMACSLAFSKAVPSRDSWGQLSFVCSSCVFCLCVSMFFIIACCMCSLHCYLFGTPGNSDAGVCEIDPRPTKVSCRTPPLPPYVKAHGCNRAISYLQAAVAQLCANFESAPGLGAGEALRALPSLSLSLCSLSIYIYIYAYAYIHVYIHIHICICMHIYIYP